MLQIIKLQFTSFDITYDKDCTDDVVQLRDGDSSDDIAATLCGSSVPLKFASTGNRLSVNFQATADKHKGGFNFTWTFVKAGNLTVCACVRVCVRACMRVCVCERYGS